MHNTRQPFLICYDIACPRRWRRVYGIVKDWATPMQKSVFVGHFREDELETLLQKLEPCIDAKTDSVQIYRLHRPEPACRLGDTLPLELSWTV